MPQSEGGKQLNELDLTLLLLLLDVSHFCCGCVYPELERGRQIPDVGGFKSKANPGRAAWGAAEKAELSAVLPVGSPSFCHSFMALAFGGPP
jgi:hypothetical protein